MWSYINNWRHAFKRSSNGYKILYVFLKIIFYFPDFIFFFFFFFFSSKRFFQMNLTLSVNMLIFYLLEAFLLHTLSVVLLSTSMSAPRSIGILVTSQSALLWLFPRMTVWVEIFVFWKQAFALN